MTSSDFLSTILIAIGLSADCFAVALGSSISMGVPSLRRLFRVSSSFGVFQALMPVLGWRAGRTVIGLIADYDHWLAFILLVMVGGRMIWESFRYHDEPSKNIDITKGLSLLTLSVATSIDALAVGLSLAFVDINIVLASSIIGTVAFSITAIGFYAGRMTKSFIGKRAETIGGAILIGIGIRILLEHIL